MLFDIGLSFRSFFNSSRFLVVSRYWVARVETDTKRAVSLRVLQDAFVGCFVSLSLLTRFRSAANHRGIVKLIQAFVELLPAAISGETEYNGRIGVVGDQGDSSG